MALRVGLFKLIDPPSDEAVEIVKDVLAKCEYPWRRVIPAILEDPDQSVLVKWDPDMQQGATGLFYGSTYEVVFGTRYAGWEDSAPFVFAHELGHLVDRATFNADEHRDLIDLMHETSGPWDDETLNGEMHTWSHDQDHSEFWTSRFNDYKFQFSEAFADLFVVTFCPTQWEGRYPRFTHWTDDFDRVREITLRRDIQVFNDVSEDHPHREGIEWAAEHGLVTGYPDGTFRPEENLTRAQLATVLYRQAEQG